MMTNHFERCRHDPLSEFGFRSSVDLCVSLVKEYGVNLELWHGLTNFEEQSVLRGNAETLTDHAAEAQTVEWERRGLLEIEKLL